MSSYEVNCTDTPAPEDVTLIARAHALCDIVLELAQAADRKLTVSRKVARALERAWPSFDDAQQQQARERLREIETRWGPMLPGGISSLHASNADPQKIAPEKVIAVWLIRRKTPDRILRVICRAVNFMEGQKRRLTDIRDHAFALEYDHVLIPVSYQQFREWLIELRVGRPEKDGRSVYWVEGEWYMIWKEVSEQLGYESKKGKAVGKSDLGVGHEAIAVATAGYGVGSGTGSVAAKQAAGGAGSKQKVGEGAETSNGPQSGPWHGTALGKIRYQMAVLRATRRRAADKTRKRAQKKFVTKRRISKAQKADKP